MNQIDMLYLLLCLMLAIAGFGCISLSSRLNETRRELHRGLAYAQAVAEHMHRAYYPDGSPLWEVCEDLPGAISQIDNMLTGLIRENNDWTPSKTDYDRNIHSNPDAKAWADFFVATYPGQAARHGLMIGWFANAMTAMHDSIKQKPAVES